MNLESNEITFVIVSFKSEKIIFNCINSLPKNSKIIVIENSYNANLKNDLENKYDNIEVILNNNTGMGSSNNIGIKKSLTKYVFILNPDVVFQHNTYSNLLEGIKKIDDCSQGYVLEFKEDEIKYIDQLIEFAKFHPKKIKLLPRSKMMYVTINKKQIEKISELQVFLKQLMSIKNEKQKH